MSDVDPSAKPPPAPIGITEEVAWTLWCPFMPRGRVGEAIHKSNCCATDQCMLWHWDVAQPNSNVRLGWCSMATLAPGEEPMTRRVEPSEPAPK